MSDDEPVTNTSDTNQSLRGLGYSSDGTMHAIPSDAEMWVDADLGENVSALCGGRFPHGKHLPVNGIRMSEAVLKEEFCRTCLDYLLGSGITVPGFISEGELVGEAARYVDTDTNRGGDDG